jgi:hypothetical protein
LQLSGSTLIRDNGMPDVTNWAARELPVGEPPN